MCNLVCTIHTKIKRAVKRLISCGQDDAMSKKLTRKYFLILLGPLGYFLNQASIANSAMTERYYSGGVYKVVSWLIGNILGWIPFSVAELMLPALVVFTLWRITVLIIRMLKVRKERWLYLRNFILNAALAA